MEIPTGIQRVLNFAAWDNTQPVYTVLKSGLTTFTVWKSRNGSTPVQVSSPTIVELSSANMSGVYGFTPPVETITVGNLREEVVYKITATGMWPVVLKAIVFEPDSQLAVAAFSIEQNAVSINKVTGLETVYESDGVTVLGTRAYTQNSNTVTRSGLS